MLWQHTQNVMLSNSIYHLIGFLSSSPSHLSISKLHTWFPLCPSPPNQGLPTHVNNYSDGNLPKIRGKKRKKGVKLLFVHVPVFVPQSIIITSKIIQKRESNFHQILPLCRFPWSPRCRFGPDANMFAGWLKSKALTRIPWELRGEATKGRNSAWMGDLPSTWFPVHPTTHSSPNLNRRLWTGFFHMSRFRFRRHSWVVLKRSSFVCVVMSNRHNRRVARLEGDNFVMQTCLILIWRSHPYGWHPQMVGVLK